ncbi:MAG: cation diffusion facilitator family transporter, partial [Candidatus Omnitrophica bacterium]|nr:cation diffusion facilitator family transporter [Candidatus Omnitrophota bacterium]
MTSKGQRFLGIAFFLTLAFCVFEFIGGKLSGSLALLADAGHMLADLSALGLAYFASWMAARPSTPRMSYGFHRIEVLSALINGVILVTMAIFIAKEAFHRLNENPEIHTGMMLGVAFVGLLFNIAAGFLLKSVAHESVNLLGAFFHVVSDALSSVGTIVAGCVIALTGWRYADPLVSFMIACLIGVSAWRLLRDVVAVLLEATPPHIDIEVLGKKVL